jgi:hypothetical protein
MRRSIITSMSTAITTRAASLAEGTGGWQRHVSLLTRRWRKMDSNFQYAGAVKLVG